MNLVDNKEIVQRARIAYHVVEPLFALKNNYLRLHACFARNAILSLLLSLF